MPTTPPKAPRNRPRGTQTIKPLKLTPARFRELHSKLDELIRINHSIPLRVIVKTMDLAFKYPIGACPQSRFWSP